MKKIYVLLLTTLMCGIMWAAGEVSLLYLEPEGTFYSSYNEKAATLVPVMYMPGAETYTFTATEEGDWEAGAFSAKSTKEFSPAYAFGTNSGNEMPLYSNPDTTYQYGLSSSSHAVSVAPNAFSWMTSGKLHVTGKSSAVVTKIAGVDNIRVYFFNKAGQTMRVTGVSIPITTNKNGTELTSLFPDSNATMKACIYKATATRGADGKYTRSLVNTALSDTITLTVDNFTPNSATAQYMGTLRGNFSDTLDIDGPFVVKIFDFGGMGAETRIYGDKSITNTTQYQKYASGATSLSTYSSSNCYLVSVNAQLPGVLNAMETDEISYESAGGMKQIAFYSNNDPKNLDIDVPSWLSYSISYENDTYSASKKCYLDLTATVNESKTEMRVDTITINNHGMKIAYRVTQAVATEADYAVPMFGSTTLTAPMLGGVIMNDNDSIFKFYTNTSFGTWKVSAPDWVDVQILQVADDTIGLKLTAPSRSLESARTDSMYIFAGEVQLSYEIVQAKYVAFESMFAKYTIFEGDYQGGLAHFQGATNTVMLFKSYEPTKDQLIIDTKSNWISVELFDTITTEPRIGMRITLAPNVSSTIREGELSISFNTTTINYTVIQKAFVPSIAQTYAGYTGFTIDCAGGYAAIMNAEKVSSTRFMLIKSNVAKEDIVIKDMPEWATAYMTDTFTTAERIKLSILVEPNIGAARDGVFYVTYNDSTFLTYTLHQDELIKQQSYYEFDGALYHGIGPKRATYTTNYVYLPYQDSVPVYSKVGPGTWTVNGNLKATDQEVFYLDAPSNVNKYVLYLPEFQASDSILYESWQWGGIAKYRSGSRIRVGSNKKAYLNAAVVHPDSVLSNGASSDFSMRSGSISGVSVPYSYGTGMVKDSTGRYDSIGTFIKLNDVLYMDTLYLPVYNSDIKNNGAEGTAYSYFGDNGKLTMTIYPAELDENGVPVIDRTRPYATMTSDSTKLLLSDSYKYYGTITFCNLVKNAIGIESVKPIITDGGSIYIELTGFNESGMNFGMYSDSYSLDKGNAWFTYNGQMTQLWSKPHNLYVTMYGFFPMMYNSCGLTEWVAPVEGGRAVATTLDVAGNDSIVTDLMLRANFDYEEWDEVEAPDWVTISYDDAAFEGGNFVAVNITVDPALTVAREGEIIFTNHGKSTSIRITQDATSGVINLFDMQNDKNVKKIIRDGHLYIIDGEKIYTAEGQRVQ